MSSENEHIWSFVCSLWAFLFLISRACYFEVSGADLTEDRQHEEGMLNFIKNFGAVADVRSFLEGQLHLPPSMHDQFSVFRKALATRFKQFGDLKTFKDQMSFFFDVFAEMKVIPTNWVVFGTSVAFLYKSTGRFAEDTGRLFQSEAMLGHFCSMRAKYILMGLKDLVQMKQLKCGDHIERVILNLATTVDSAVCLTYSDGLGTADASMSLIGALSGFDGVSWRHDWLPRVYLKYWCCSVAVA